jgi:hypothetical protein
MLSRFVYGLMPRIGCLFTQGRAHLPLLMARAYSLYKEAAGDYCYFFPSAHGEPLHASHSHPPKGAEAIVGGCE